MGTTGAAAGTSAGDWAGAFCGTPGTNATTNAKQRNALDTSPPWSRGRACAVSLKCVISAYH